MSINMGKIVIQFITHVHCKLFYSVKGESVTNK